MPFDHARFAVLGEMHGDALHRALDALDPRARDAARTCVSVRRSISDGGCLRVLLAEEGGRLEDGDMRAEHAVGLRQLDADRAAADHDEMLDPLADVEDRLVGEIGDLVEPGIGGTAASEPVAMTKRRARISTRPASTVNLSRKLACAWITRTPSPVKRSTKSFGAMRGDHAMHVVVHARDGRSAPR